MAFDPDQYLKEKTGGFDPDAYLAEKAGGGPGQGQAALEHFGKGATLGYLPQLQALAEPQMDRILDQFTGKHVADNEQPYVERRDANIKRQALEAKEFPKTAIASEIGGGLAGGAMLSTAMPIDAATKAARIAQAAKAGAAIGALQNPGDAEGVVDPTQFEDRGKNAALGGALGGTLHGAAESAGAGWQRLQALLDKARGGARNFAEEKAATALGPTKGEFKKLYDKDRVNQVGRQLLDEGVVTPFATPGKIATRLGGKIDSAEENVDQLIKNAGERARDPQFLGSLDPATRAHVERLNGRGIDPSSVADEMKRQIVESYRGVPNAKIQPALDEIDAWLTTQPKSMSIEEVQDLKQQMNKFLKDSDFHREVGMGKQGTLAVRRGLKEGVEHQADLMADALGENGGEIKDANRRLGNLIESQKIAEGGLSRSAVNRSMGLTDTIAGVGGAGVGAHVGGVAGPEGAKVGAMLGAGIGGAVNKVARTFGRSMQATGADKLADILEKYPDALGKMGGKLQELYQQNPGGVLAALQQQKNSPQFQPEDSDRLKNLLIQSKGKANRAPTDNSEPAKQYIPHDEAKKMFEHGN